MPPKRSMGQVGETVSPAGLLILGGRQPARTGFNRTRLLPAHAALAEHLDCVKGGARAQAAVSGPWPSLSLLALHTCRCHHPGAEVVLFSYSGRCGVPRFLPSRGVGVTLAASAP